MKSTTRIKYIFLGASFCMAQVIQLCFSDPYTSSKANVTQVKLIHVKNPGNTSNDSLYSPMAKISKIVQIKRFSSGKSARRNVTKSVHREKTYNNSSIFKLIKPFLKHKLGNPILKQDSNSGFLWNNGTTTTTSTSTTTALPEAPLKQTRNESSKAKPLFLSTKSWDYINSIAKNAELHRIISGLSFDEIKNASTLSKTDAKAAEVYLLNIIINELGKFKRARMLDLGDKGDHEHEVNTGVRYSSKRRPVLNVIPLFNQEDEDLQEKKEDKPKDNYLNSIGYRNLTGHMSNLNDETSTVPTEKSKDEKESKLHESASSPHSTAASLMHVLVAPEYENFRASTYSPPYSSHFDDNNGFVPVIPMFNPMDHPASVTVPMFPVENDLKPDIEEHNGIGSTAFIAPTPRKARGPPKEEEYQLPSLTTSSTVKPEVSSYQTITEGTTEGPKIVWYYHDQKPEDTFYPNSDNFLVPPEEASVEMQMMMKPIHEDISMKNPAAFTSPYSSDTGSKTNEGNSYGDNGKMMMTPSSNENRYIGGRANTDLIKLTTDASTNERKKLPPLQQQGTTIVDHYPDEDLVVVSGAGGYSGRRKPSRPRHQEKYYDPPPPPPPSSSFDEIKYHDTPSRERDKPYTSGITDTAHYIALSEHDHRYHDSYPAKHEVGPSFHRESDRERGYYRDRDRDEPSPIHRPYRGEYSDRYREGSERDSDYYSRRPYSERDRDRDRHRESSPYQHGHHDYGGGHGWRDPHKDFFSKAKNYLKNSDFSTAEKWFDVSIGVLAFLAFGGYIIMLLYQVFAVSSATPVGALFGKSLQGAGEIFDVFFSKGPIGQAYMDELETIVKRAMANVKRIWMTKSFAQSKWPVKQVKGEVDAK